MNNIYSDAFMDMDDLFAVTDPPLVTNPVVIIKNKIRDDFIIPNAVDTTDAKAITPLPQCALSRFALAIDILIGASRQQL